MSYIIKPKLNWLLIFTVFALPACKKVAVENSLKVEPSTWALNRNYDSVCFLMTHNAMNNAEKGFTVPNQTYSITNQLKDGVRGLMIDTYDGSSGIALTYHFTDTWGSEKLVDVLQEIKDFLMVNDKEIVTIIFENNGSNTQLQKAIDSIGLDKMAYIHSGIGNWPLIQTLVDSNKRLVLFVEHNNMPRENYLMHAWSIIFDTQYTFKNVSEFSSDVNRGGGGTKELYLINHWLGNAFGLPDKSLAMQANTHEELSKRVHDCTTANNHFLNYLGVDFYEVGAAKMIVDSINGR